MYRSLYSSGTSCSDRSRCARVISRRHSFVSGPTTTRLAPTNETNSPSAENCMIPPVCPRAATNRRPALSAATRRGSNT